MLTTSAKNTMLDALPATVYVGLYAGGAPGTGSEIDPETLWGAAEERPAVSLAAAADGARKPAADAVVGILASAATTTHVGWFSAATGGTLLGSSVHARTYAATDTVNVKATDNVFAITD